jgi:hypothetical protein
MARSTVFRYKNDDRDPTAIGNELGAPPEGIRANEEAYRSGGWSAVGRLNLDWLEGRKKVGQTVGPIEWAQGYAMAGDFDRAFDHLEKAYDEHNPMLRSIRLNPWLQGLGSDPRLEDLQSRIRQPAP